MVETIPDLQRTGQSVLDLLAPDTPNAVAISQKLKMLNDPSNTQSKRLHRSVQNLGRDMKNFGNDVYIVVEDISRSFSSAFASRRGEISNWRPDAIVQMANCARFAERILMTGSNKYSRKQALQHIEKLFPLPFMSGLVDPEQPKEPGQSALEGETIDLALTMRTQSLILHLEDNLDNDQFKPKEAAKLWFFKGLSSSSPARGLNLPNFNGPDGALPDRYKANAREICNDILMSEDAKNNELLDVEELKGAYLWRRFVLQAAQWLRKRTNEIKTDLQKHIGAQDVSETFFSTTIPSFGSTLENERVDPSGEVAEEAPQQANAGSALEADAPESREEQPEPQEQPESRPLQRDTERRRSSKKP